MYRSHLFYIRLRRLKELVEGRGDTVTILKVEKRQPSIRYLPDVLLLGVKGKRLFIQKSAII